MSVMRLVAASTASVAKPLALSSDITCSRIRREVASGRSSAAELRDAGADVVLDDLADTAGVVRAVELLTTPAVAG